VTLARAEDGAGTEVLRTRAFGLDIESSFELPGFVDASAEGGAR